MGAKELAVLERIAAKPELQPLFFKRAVDLKWFEELKRRGFFDPSANPAPRQASPEDFWRIPFWPALQYLENTAGLLSREENARFIEAYLLVVEDIALNSTGGAEHNYHTWRVLAKVLAAVPPESLRLRHLQQMERGLSTRFDSALVADVLGNRLLPKLAASTSPGPMDLAIPLLGILIKRRITERRLGERASLKEASFICGDWMVARILERNARIVGERLGARGVELLVEAIVAVQDEVEAGGYSSLARPSIAASEQNLLHRNRPFGILIDGARDALIAHVEAQRHDAVPYLDELLERSQPIARRLAINAITVCADHLPPYGAKVLIREHFRPVYRHEMFLYLRSQFSRLPDQTRSEFKDYLSGLEVDVGVPVEHQEAELASRRLRWLAAVKDAGDKELSDLYWNLASSLGGEPKHPEFSAYVSGGPVRERSPITVQEARELEAASLVSVLLEFEESPISGGPTVAGLGRVIQETLKEKPGALSGHLMELVGSGYYFIYSVLAGYRELAGNAKVEDWSEVIGFCRALLLDKRFWTSGAESLVHGGATRDWVVGEIAEVIDAVAANDEIRLSTGCLKDALTCLQAILENQTDAEFEAGEDPVFTAINCARGKGIEALFSYALRTCRIAHEESGEHAQAWQAIAGLFDREVELAKVLNQSFVTLCGNYLSNLLYLDEEWAERRIPEVFGSPSGQRWRAAMHGYAYAKGMSRKVFDLLQSGGYLKAAIDETALADPVRQRAVRDTLVGYLRRYEELNDPESTISHLIARGSPEDLREMIRDAWMFRNGPRDEVSPRVLDLWKAVVRGLRQRGRVPDVVLSNLNLLTVFLDSIEEPYLAYLTESAPLADVEHNTPFLLTELRRLCDGSANAVSVVISAMLERYRPDYDLNDVVAIAEALWRQGGALRAKSRRIANAYLMDGNEIIQDRIDQLDLAEET